MFRVRSRPSTYGRGVRQVGIDEGVEAMMPAEEENRRLVRETFSRELSASAEMIHIGGNLFQAMDSANPTELSGRARIAIKSLVARQIQQFRAIVAVCEIGLHDSAEVLIRSLYEGLLALRFILHEPIGMGKCSKALQDARRKLPRIPAGPAGVDFRAVLYGGSARIKKLLDAEEISKFPDYQNPIPPQAIESLRQDVALIRSEIGPAWSNFFQGRHFTYSGLSIKLLAENCDLKEFHLKIYPMLCAVAHGHDGLSFVRVAAKNTFEFRLVGKINLIRTALHSTGSLISATLDDVSAVFAPSYRAQIRTVLQAITADSCAELQQKDQ
jgi:uncharacterized protein DUF5677